MGVVVHGARLRSDPCASTLAASGSLSPRDLDLADQQLALAKAEESRVRAARGGATPTSSCSATLADEPTAALDRDRGRAVMDLFRKVAHEQGSAVLVVTHDHRALDAFDALLGMEDGALIDAPPAVA